MKSDPCSPGKDLMQLFPGLDDLLGNYALFRDPARADEENEGPYVVVVDDFFDDPDQIRALALDMKFVSYWPPDADIVGADIAAEYVSAPGRWLSTSFGVWRGKPVKNPAIGE